MDRKTKHAEQSGRLVVREGEQLAILPLESVPVTYVRRTLPRAEVPMTVQRERNRLEKKYAARLVERLDWRRLVTYVLNKDLPVYNWFKYKEGFSRELVQRMFREFKLQKGDIVFDPFAGCGTTLMCCKEMAMHGIGLDILPTSVFVTRAKLVDWKDLFVIEHAVEKLLAMPFRQPVGTFPDVKIINLAFDQQTQREILFFKEAIEEYEKPTRDFLLLGLMSILESVSKTSKDGQFLRLVEKPSLKVRDALATVLTTMLHDLSRRERSDDEAKGTAEVFEGDAREMCLPKKYEGKVAAIITSPPYLNRYDYSRTYALELCLLTVKSHRDMVNIRHSLLRSHVESREHQGKDVSLPALAEVLRGVRSKPLNNERLPIMIQGYFEDMNLVIRNMAAYLKPGGRVALVVANAQFNGESVPTDLMLCELAEQQGLATEAVWITRYKGNSSQQMAVYGRRPVRETIVFWRKNG